MSLRRRTVERLRRLNAKRRLQAARYRSALIALGICLAMATVGIVALALRGPEPPEKAAPRPVTIELGSGQAGVKTAAKAPSLDFPEKAPPPPRPRQRGVASFYADKFEGRRTASGETFRQKVFTAAHRTLPFGTRLRVTHARTGKSVVVRVNDRGPFHPDRVIDLSRAAARELGLLQAGHGRVELEILAK